MQIYVGLVAGYDGLVFMPGKYAEMPEVQHDINISMEPLPDAELHRMLMVNENRWSEDSDVPGSVFSMKYACTNPDHDHYGEENYAVVIQGELEANRLTKAEVDDFMKDIKLLYTELEEVYSN